MKYTFELPQPLYMYDYEKRGIPKAKPPKVIPMVRVDINKNNEK